MLEGQTLYQLESVDHERLTLDLSALKSGIYFIEVQGEECIGERKSWSFSAKRILVIENP
jgi:hypothetical protein